MFAIFNSRRWISMSVLALYNFFVETHNADAATLSAPPLPRLKWQQGITYEETFQDSAGNDFRSRSAIAVPELRLLPSSAAKRYRDILDSTTFPDKWTYRVAEARDGEFSLRGNFNSTIYQPCPLDENACSHSNLNELGGPNKPFLSVLRSGRTVGAELALSYTPLSGEPSGSNANYLQILSVSYASRLTGPYKDNVPAIDVNYEQGLVTPLFLTSYAIPAGTFFYDRPETELSDRRQSFKADLFFVEQGSGNKITIYDGVSWGFENFVGRVPKPDPNQLTSLPPSQKPSRTARRPPCPAGMPIQSCIAFGFDYGGVSYAGVPLEEIAPSELSFDEPAAAPESVPTPALLPGMIATGIYHGRKWRKRRQQIDSDNIAA
jgi:hypothetical protein